MSADNFKDSTILEDDFEDYVLNALGKHLDIYT